MQVSVKMNFNIDKIDVDLIRQIGLNDSSNAVQAQAVENAPYQTGKLKQSIDVDPKTIKKSTKSVRVGPRKVVYAIVREFVNKKNPHRRFYMKRAFEKADTIAKKSFERAITLVLRKMSKK